MTEDHPPLPRKAPWHLWPVGVFGLLWNSVAALDYLMIQTRNEAYGSHFTPDQLEVFHGFPMWLVAFWALAVWGGVAGALLLLLRKALAGPVLLASLLAMVGTAIHNSISNGGLYETGGTGPGFLVVIFLIALGLWAYARAMDKRGVLA